MIKLKHILLEQYSIPSPNKYTDPKLGVLFEPNRVAQKIMQLKNSTSASKFSDLKNIIIACKDANAYNNVSVEFKKMSGGLSIPEFIFKFILTKNTNQSGNSASVNFLRSIITHLTQIKCSPLFITPYSIKLKELTTKLGVQLDANAVVDKNASIIAKKIYDAKGYIIDDESAGVAAILSIKDANQFNRVQSAFKTISGGKDIATYICSFILPKGGSLADDGGLSTIETITKIIDHLFKIKAPKSQIDILDEKNKWIFRMAQTQKDISAQGGGGLHLAWQHFSDVAKDDPTFRHQYFTALGIATGFIPVVGWAVSAGIFALDSADQYRQGNMREAGLSAVFAAIPLIGKPLGLLAKMPAVARLGERGMAALGEKLAMSGDPVLSAIERLAIKETWKQQYFLKNGIDKYMRSSLANQITNSAARDQIRQQLGARGANVIFKIADGSIKASVFGAKTATVVGSYNAGIEGYQRLFDKYYAIPKMKAASAGLPDVEDINSDDVLIPKY